MIKITLRQPYWGASKRWANKGWKDRDPGFGIALRKLKDKPATETVVINMPYGEYKISVGEIRRIEEEFGSYFKAGNTKLIVVPKSRCVEVI